MVLLCVGRIDASPGMWKGMCRFDTEMTLGLAFGKVAIVRISYKMENTVNTLYLMITIDYRIG